MEKLSGKICDVCRTMFYPGDHVIEMCEKCANTVWCIFDIYEDGSRELSSIHRTQEGALLCIEQNKELIENYCLDSKNKIIEQEVIDYFIL